jgi:bifunctional DNA-binding transcriptional regulator/antitoxin component of YhaV-PrlF toxin-antitoxin module
VATDIATGDAPIITSRADHKAFLKRNGYIEVGNEFNNGPRRKPIDIDGPGDRARRREDIRHAIREVTGRR